MSLRPLILVLSSLALTLSAGASANPSIGDFVLSPATKACLYARINQGKALVAAMPVVYGSPRHFDCKEFEAWAQLAATPELNMANDFATGLSYTQAVKFLRFELAKSNNAANRVQVVRDAIDDVYGREPSSDEMITLQQQIAANQAWYAGIVSNETKKLNNDKAARQATIDRAYMKAMGRKASAGDQSYWINRPEHFELLVVAARNYLYSPSGAEDLKQTVVRALAPATGRGAPAGRAMSAGEINAAIAKFTPEKKIFVEMK